jgi:hypothetical protein
MSDRNECNEGDRPYRVAVLDARGRAMKTEWFESAKDAVRRADELAQEWVDAHQIVVSAGDTPLLAIDPSDKAGKSRR